MPKYLQIVLALCACLVAGACAAPRNHHHKRRQLSSWELLVRPEREWVNPCNLANYNEPTEGAPATTTVKRPFKAKTKNLRDFVNLKIVELSSKTAIDTHNIGEWFAKNATYDFLERINGSRRKIALATWYDGTQVYIGALQNLMTKQRYLDSIKNEEYGKTKELGLMMMIGKSLLCEISTTMRKANLTVPQSFGKDEMAERLNFSSATEVDTLDLQFTKVRFIEYLRGMHDVLMLKFRNHQLRQMQTKSKGAANGINRRAKGASRKGAAAMGANGVNRRTKEANRKDGATIGGAQQHQRRTNQFRDELQQQKRQKHRAEKQRHRLEQQEKRRSRRPVRT